MSLTRTHPAKILYGMLGRPQYISETRPSASDSPKCLTLGLGRMPRFSHGKLLVNVFKPTPHVPGGDPYALHSRVKNRILIVLIFIIEQKPYVRSIYHGNNRKVALFAASMRSNNRLPGKISYCRPHECIGSPVTFVMHP